MADHMNEPVGRTLMAEETAAGWSHRYFLAADAAQQALDTITVYLDDARRAFQRRIDNESMSEAVANQQHNTNRLAQEAIQAKTGAMLPPYMPGFHGGVGPGGYQPPIIVQQPGA